MLLLGVAIMDRAGAQLKRAASNRDQLIALNLAEAGVDKAIWSLYQLHGTGYTGESNTNLGAGGQTVGRFAVTVTTPSGGTYPNPRRIVAQGRALGSLGQGRALEDLIVRVHLNLSSEGSSAAFNYGIFTDGPQVYNGGGDPDTPIVNDGSVHSNTSAVINNPSHNIVVSPYVVEAPNWPNYPGYIPFPTLDFDFYRTYAQTDPGSDYANGSTFVNLPSSPNDVLFVEGLHGETIDIDRDAYGMIIVIGGNVRIFGNREFYGLIYIDEDQSQGGTFNATAFEILGTSKVYGAVVARSFVNPSGTPRVYYDRSRFGDPRLAPPAGPARVTVDSWEED
jgi:hypothetical protein